MGTTDLTRLLAWMALATRMARLFTAVGAVSIVAAADCTAVAVIGRHSKLAVVTSTSLGALAALILASMAALKCFATDMAASVIRGGDIDVARYRDFMLAARHRALNHDWALNFFHRLLSLPAWKISSIVSAWEEAIRIVDVDSAFWRAWVSTNIRTA